MKALDRAAKAAGSLAKLASLIGVKKSLPGMWKHRESVPPEYCAAIEAATGVTRQELRPQDWQAIWPELGTIKTPEAPKPRRRNTRDEAKAE